MAKHTNLDFVTAALKFWTVNLNDSECDLDKLNDSECDLDQLNHIMAEMRNLNPFNAYATVVLSTRT